MSPYERMLLIYKVFHNDVKQKTFSQNVKNVIKMINYYLLN